MRRDTLQGFCGLHCEVKCTSDEIAGLESSWRGVWEADPASTPFQSFDWVRLWFTHYKKYVKRPFVIACFDGEQCVAIAPLYVRKAGLIPPQRSTLMFTGTGEAERDESFAEYMAPLCLPEYQEHCSAAFAQVIHGEFGGPIAFLRVRPESVEALVEAIGCLRGRKAMSVGAGHNYYMRCGTDNALADLSAKQRSGLSRKLRKLREEPSFAIETASDEDSRVRLFADLIRLHIASWRARGKRGVFANRRFREFHQELSRSLLERDQLLLLSLRVSGKSVAVIYAMCDSQSSYYYQSGIDLSSLSSLSPGILAHLFVAEESMRRGCSQYDLMIASGESYKAKVASRAPELRSYSLQ